MDDATPSSPNTPSNVGATGELDAEVIHKDGSVTNTALKQSLITRILGWFVTQ